MFEHGWATSVAVDGAVDGAAALRFAAPSDAAPSDAAPTDASPVGLFTDAAPSAVEDAWWRVLRDWWLRDRPAWVVAGWFDARLSGRVVALLDLQPGPALVAALAALPTGAASCECPPPADWHPVLDAGMGPACACAAVVAAAWQVCSDWAGQKSDDTLLAVAGHAPVVVPGTGSRVVDPSREALAAGLRTSPAAMAQRLARVRRDADLRTIPTAVRDGLLTATAARAAAGELAHLPSADPAAADSAVSDLLQRVAARRASGLRAWSPGEVRRESRAAALRHAPHAHAERQRAARAGRRVEVHPDQEPGTAVLAAVLPDTDAQRIHRRLTSLAAAIDDAGRTRDQIRADIFTDLLLHAPHPADAAAAPRSGEAAVVIDLPTLLRLADNPCELSALGPVDAEAARILAADSAWRFWITNAAGTPIAVAATTYTPPAGLARLVRAREPRCRMPGCRMPSASCDLDHTTPWPAGSTVAQNLGPLCRRHHNLKTQRLWQLNSTCGQDIDSHPAWTWTAPDGTTHRDHPPPPLPG